MPGSSTIPQPYSRSFIKGSAIVIVAQGLAAMQSIILLPIVIKTVGVTTYGGYIIIVSFLGFIMGISSFGVGFKMTRFLPSTKDMLALRALFFPQFFLRMSSILFLSLGIILLDKKISHYMFNSEIGHSSVVMAFYLLCYFLYAQGSEYLRYTSRITYMTLGSLAVPFLNMGFVLMLYYLNLLSINSLVLAASLSSLIIAVPWLWLLVREIGITFPGFDLGSIMSDIRLGVPLLMNYVADFVLSGSDRYVIALLLSVTAVGYYNPAYALGSVIVFIPKAMGTVVPQLMCRAVDNKEEHWARSMVNYQIKLFLLIAIPFVFGSAVLSKQILTLLATGEVASNAFLVTPIVALGTLFYGLNTILSNILYVRLRTSALFGINVSASAFNLIANMIFIYLFRSLIVAAISTCISYLLVCIYIYHTVKDDWPVDFHAFAIMKSIIASVAMLCFLLWVSSCLDKLNATATLAIELVLGVGSYLLLLFALRTFSSSEIKIMKSFSF